jgi:uncharacterized protein YkwD
MKFWLLLSLPLYLFLMGCGTALAHPHDQKFMPDNDLWTEDKQQASNITEEEFNQVLDDIEAVYQPIISGMGATFQLERAWSDSTVNAYADQKGCPGTGCKMIVHMYGGMARRSEMNVAGFGLVACHEIGHHLGGFPLWDNSPWASNEGNSDFYANYVCAPRVFSRLPVPAVSQLAKDKCDAAWSDQPGRESCYKGLDGGLALSKLLAVLGSTKIPQLDTPDPTVVEKTQSKHPKAQCRLDSYLAGSLCSKAYDVNQIPKDELAFCATRPKCWFKASDDNGGGGGDEPTPDPTPDPDADYATMGQINAARVENDRKALGEDPALICATARHAADIGQAGKCSHQGTDGSTIGQRLRDCGYKKQFVEIVACKFPNPEAAVKAWMRSQGNRYAILDKRFSSLGCSTINNYYVCILGK